MEILQAASKEHPLEKLKASLKAAEMDAPPAAWRDGHSVAWKDFLSVEQWAGMKEIAMDGEMASGLAVQLDRKLAARSVFF